VQVRAVRVRDNYRIDVDHFVRFLTLGTRVVILGNPSNPLVCLLRSGPARSWFLMKLITNMQRPIRRTRHFFRFPGRLTAHG